MISDFQLFSALNPDEISRIASNCQRKSFQPGQTIFRQGDSGCNLYLIEKGKVEISVFSCFVPRKVVAVLEEKEYFGEMSILNRRKRRSATVVAIEKTDLIIIPEQEVEFLVENFPSIALNMLKTLSRRLEETNTHSFVLDIWKFISSDRNIVKLLNAAVYTAEAALGYHSEIVLDLLSTREFHDLLFSEETIRNIASKTEKEKEKVKLLFSKDSLLIIDDFENSLVNDSVFSQPLLIEGKILGYFRFYADKAKIQPDENVALKAFSEQVATVLELELSKYKLRLMENRLNGIFETIADGILVLDENGVPSMSNRSFNKMFFPEGCQNDALNAVLPSLYQAGRDTGTQELVLLKPHAQVLSSNFITTRDSKGNRSETIISIRNVTAPKREEQKFLQLVSMLIRRVYNLYLPILGISEPLREKRFRRVKRMIRNFIYLIEIKSGPLRVQRMPMTIGEFYDEMWEKVTPLFARRRISLLKEFDENVNKTEICVDSELLIEAFISILAYHGRRLSFDSHIRFEEVIEVADYRLNLITRKSDWRIKPGPEILDWQKCVEWFIAAENRAVLLELPFSRHIFESHKGTVDFIDEGDFVKFSLFIPAEK
ncbi:MAG: cyclic nucleotide-binding domain-containing protein [Candidatus Riflebacteria bacterium]|nr:cyclic nucleotide-binding domain-containing protein [Candidatus Riflebacteria bacterium]